VRKAARSQRKELQVSIRFEPNRLSDQCLANAYELAFPVIQQDTTRKRSKERIGGKLPDFEQKKVGNLNG
jgi:hypothetical protein